MNNIYIGFGCWLLGKAPGGGGGKANVGRPRLNVRENIGIKYKKKCVN